MFHGGSVISKHMLRPGPLMHRYQNPTCAPRLFTRGSDVTFKQEVAHCGLVANICIASLWTLLHGVQLQRGRRAREHGCGCRLMARTRCTSFGSPLVFGFGLASASYSQSTCSSPPSIKTMSVFRSTPAFITARFS